MTLRSPLRFEPFRVHLPTGRVSATSLAVRFEFMLKNPDHPGWPNAERLGIRVPPVGSDEFTVTYGVKENGE